MDPFPNQGAVFTEISISMCAVTLLLVIFRLSYLAKTRGWLGAEDYMVVASMVSLLISTVLGCIATGYGFGQRKTEILSGHGNLSKALQYFFLFQITYKITICFNKLGFLLLYYRVFVTRYFQRICIATIIIVVLGTYSFVLATIFQCTPIAKFWDKGIHGHCITNAAFRWSWAAYNLITDLFIVVMPIPVIRRLHMDRAKKAGLVIIFAMGLFTCATSAFRMKALVTSTQQPDTTWDSGPTFIWSEVEAAIGLVNVTLPPLKKLISEILPKSWRMISGGSGSRKTGTTSTHSGRPKTSHMGVQPDIELQPRFTTTIAACPTESSENLARSDPNKVHMTREVSVKVENAKGPLFL